MNTDDTQERALSASTALSVNSPKRPFFHGKVELMHAG